MSSASKIEWTDSTVNFWWGCTKVGPGCDHCYAETWARRTGGNLWGVGVPRRKIKSAVALIHRLDNDYSEWAADYYAHEGNARAFGLPAPTYGPRRRVFIQSMSDLFDLEVPAEWFAEAWGKIEVCNRIDIQIVTKRLSAVTKRLSEVGCSRWPQHAGLIATVVNQDEVERELPRLVGLKLRLGIPWIGLSVEPMLGAIDLTRWLRDLNWVICGGESGRNARPMHPAWPRGLRDQCASAGVPFFFKQWGAWSDHTDSAPKDRRAAQDHIFTASGEVLGVGVMHGRHGMVEKNWKEKGGAWMGLVGKKAAGRLLDNRTHDDMPGRG